MRSQGLVERAALHDLFANLGKSPRQQRLVGLLVDGVQGIVQGQAGAEQGRHLAGRGGQCAGRQFAGRPEAERQSSGPPLSAGLAQFGGVDPLAAQLLADCLAPGTVDRPGFFTSLVIETGVLKQRQL